MRILFIFLAVLTSFECASTIAQDLRSGTVAKALPKLLAPTHALLRYGNKTPRPTSYHDAVLQIGTFKSEINKLGTDNVNYVCTGIMQFGGVEVKVVIKPDQDLKNKTIRSDISRSKDNRSSDAAYQLSRFIDLVDTPAHIIRDDAPIPGSEADLNRIDAFSTSARGSAGVQVFSADSVEPDSVIVAQIESSAQLLIELEEIAVFDCLIGNTDRHGRNWRFRKKPTEGSRHIVAIDHSLAFPTRDRRSFGNYSLIQMHLRSAANGRISERNLQKLQSLLHQRANIDHILQLNLERTECDLTWRRLEQMLRQKKVFLP